MAKKSQGATRSVLAKRPTYAVTGIVAGLRHRDPLLFSVSSMAVLSDFLPMLFANVPYDLTLTQGVHVVCARTSAGVLVLMAAVLIATMFVNWPTFPVDHRSIAGQMWYVAESRWLEKMEGTAVMTERERKETLRSMGGLWRYGIIQTSLGDREAVEMDDTYGMIAYSEMDRRQTPLLY
jgi:fluoride exporter